MCLRVVWRILRASVHTIQDIQFKVLLRLTVGGLGLIRYVDLGVQVLRCGGDSKNLRGVKVAV